MSWEKLSLVLTCTFFWTVHANLNTKQVSFEQIKYLNNACLFDIEGDPAIELLYRRLLLQLHYH